MPIPTPPTEDTSWATTGTKTDPGSAQKNTGWLYRQKVPFDILNWLFAAYNTWKTYLATAVATFYDDYYNGRDPDWGGTGLGDGGYQYDTDNSAGGKVVSWELTPLSGGFHDRSIDDSATYAPVKFDDAANPPYAYPSLTGGKPALARISLMPWILQAGGYEQALKIATSSIRVKGDPTSSTITLTIYSVLGNAVRTAEWTVTYDATLAAGFANKAATINLDLTPGKLYYAEIYMTDNTTGTDVGCNLWNLLVVKTRVE